MLHLMLATFRKDPKTIVGYAFYCYNTKQVVQVPVEGLVEFSKGHKIVNAEFATDKKGIKLVGTNGTIDRYPILDVSTGKVVGKSPLIVISRLNDGFRLINAFGEITLLTTKEAVMYCKFNGIANGKITSIKGTETISSIAGNYPDEDITIKVKAPVEVVKGKEEVKKEPFMRDEFYKVLEQAFGKKRANIIRYLIETRKVAVNVLVDITKSHEKGIALAGLLFYTADKNDVKLRALLSEIVDTNALDIVDYMTNKGIALDSYWDATVCLPVHKTTSKKDIDKGFMENCVGNYIIANGCFEDITIAEDGAFATYKGDEISKDKYSVAGYNPVTKGIVFIDDSNNVKIAKIG